MDIDGPIPMQGLQLISSRSHYNTDTWFKPEISCLTRTSSYLLFLVAILCVYVLLCLSRLHLLTHHKIQIKQNEFDSSTLDVKDDSRNKDSSAGTK